MSEQDYTPDMTPGIISWNELCTTNAEASQAFYTGLLGWTAETVDMPNGQRYTMFMAGSRPAGGMVQPPAEAGEVPTYWASYITVVDLDATVAKAVEMGATLVMPATEVPDKGRFACLIDPQGAPISFWQFLGDGSC